MDKLKRERAATARSSSSDDEETPDGTEPELLAESVTFWKGFTHLNGQRAYTSDGPQPLSISDIAATAALIQVDHEDAEWFLEVIGVLDKEFLGTIYAKMAKEREKAARKAAQKSKSKRGVRG